MVEEVDKKILLVASSAQDRNPNTLGQLKCISREAIPNPSPNFNCCLFPILAHTSYITDDICHLCFRYFTYTIFADVKLLPCLLRSEPILLEVFFKSKNGCILNYYNFGKHQFRSMFSLPIDTNDFCEDNKKYQQHPQEYGMQNDCTRRVNHISQLSLSKLGLVRIN